MIMLSFLDECGRQAPLVNRAAQEMPGWSADDLIGCEPHSIIHHQHLDGRAFPAHECQIYSSFRRDEAVRKECDKNLRQALAKLVRVLQDRRFKRLGKVSGPRGAVSGGRDAVGACLPRRSTPK